MSVGDLVILVTLGVALAVAVLFIPVASFASVLWEAHHVRRSGNASAWIEMTHINTGTPLFWQRLAYTIAAKLFNLTVEEKQGYCLCGMACVYSRFVPSDEMVARDLWEQSQR